MVRIQNRNQNSGGDYTKSHSRRMFRRGDFGWNGPGGRGNVSYQYHRSAKRRLVIQSAISLVIFLTIIAVFTWPGAGMAKARAVIRNYLVEDYGMTPVFNFVDTVMAWGNSLDWNEDMPNGRASLGSLPEGSRPPSSQVTLPADGRVLPAAGDEDQGTAGEESLTARITGGGDWLEDSLAVSAETGGEEGAAAGLWIETAPEGLIRAAMAGTVTAAVREDTGLYCLELACGEGWSFRYSHLDSLAVAEGAAVEQGAELGRAGKSSPAVKSSGTSSGGASGVQEGAAQSGADGAAGMAEESSKVCVQVYYNGGAIDPISFFLGGL